MNFLAHAYLSFADEEILVGNMISDFVKGRRKDEYPNGIRNGIILHRLIDAYTDTHPATTEAKSFFRPAYSLYSGAMVDVVFDHFLANDPAAFNNTSLFTFSQQVYAVLNRHIQVLPVSFAAMLPYMQSQNWLYHYRDKQGIYNSFGGLVRRAAYLQDSEPAKEIFDQYYAALEQCFRLFWGDMQRYALEQYKKLQQTT